MPNTLKVNNLDIGGSLNASNQSGFRAYRTAVQAIPSGAWTKVQFNIEEYDTKNEYDNGTNYRFTVTEAGVYAMSSVVTLTNLGLGKIYQIMLYKNNSAYYRGTYSVTAALSTHSMNLSTIAKAAASDYFEIFVHHDHGSDLNVEDQAYSTSFEAVKIA